MRDLFAYLIVKAGSMYCLLNDNQAGNARKEVLISEFSVNQQVCEKEINVRLMYQEGYRSNFKTRFEPKQERSFYHGKNKN